MYVSRREMVQRRDQAARNAAPPAAGQLLELRQCSETLLGLLNPWPVRLQIHISLGILSPACTCFPNPGLIRPQVLKAQQLPTKCIGVRQHPLGQLGAEPAADVCCSYMYSYPIVTALSTAHHQTHIHCLLLPPSGWDCRHGHSPQKKLLARASNPGVWAGIL